MWFIKCQQQVVLSIIYCKKKSDLLTFEKLKSERFDLDALKNHLTKSIVSIMQNTHMLEQS